MKEFKQGAAAPEGGALYQKKTQVRMWRQDDEFRCESREGTLVGQPGDYLVEDGHGGFYPVSAEFHEENYEEVPDAPPA